MSQYVFEQPKFEPIIESFLNSNCNNEQMPPILRKPMRVYFKENIPEMWMSDGFNYIECHFS